MSNGYEIMFDQAWSLIRKPTLRVFLIQHGVKQNWTYRPLYALLVRNVYTCIYREKDKTFQELWENVIGTPFKNIMVCNRYTCRSTVSASTISNICQLFCNVTCIYDDNTRMCQDCTMEIKCNQQNDIH